MQFFILQVADCDGLRYSIQGSTHQSRLVLGTGSRIPDSIVFKLYNFPMIYLSFTYFTAEINNNKDFSCWNWCWYAEFNGHTRNPRVQSFTLNILNMPAPGIHRTARPCARTLPASEWLSWSIWFLTDLFWNIRYHRYYWVILWEMIFQMPLYCRYCQQCQSIRQLAVGSIKSSLVSPCLYWK